MKILDTTIRDGSYAINFNYTCKDVIEICKRLEKLNIEYVEIGHGQGLNASSMEHGMALHTDLEYLLAAKSVSNKIKIGFFCIPGIAGIDDLDMLSEHGGDFVRIGIAADEIEKAIPFIQHAKSVGLVPMVNFMKSYTCTPEQLAKSSMIAASNGAAIVYIVDSAGCMLQNDIASFYNEIRKKTSVKIGFHGHNNLGLAVANSVFCADIGFDFIDTSFQGLGRSLGNASTEQTIMSLMKKGYQLDVDIPRLLEYGYVSLRDLGIHNVQNPLDLICGYAGFHSSFLKYIYKCCNEKKVDPLRLILAYTNRNMKTMDYGELCKVAETLPVDKDDNPYKFDDYYAMKFEGVL